MNQIHRTKNWFLKISEISRSDSILLRCSGHEGEEKGDESKEEEPKEMTLEEWKEIQEKYRAKLEYNTRKPGEGEKKGQWKNTSVLKKTDDSDPLFMQKRVRTLRM